MAIYCRTHGAALTCTKCVRHSLREKKLEYLHDETQVEKKNE